MGAVVPFVGRTGRALSGFQERGGDFHNGDPHPVINLSPDVEKEQLLRIMHELAVLLGIRDSSSILRPIHKDRKGHPKGGGDLR